MCLGLRVLTHQKPPRRFCMLFFDVLPFTTLAVSVNGKTSKKSVQKRRGGVWCVFKGLDTPNTAASFLSCFCLKFYRLPTTCCENDTICHAFLSSFTTLAVNYEHMTSSQIMQTQPRRFCFSLKFYRLRRSRRR